MKPPSINPRTLLMSAAIVALAGWFAAAQLLNRAPSAAEAREPSDVSQSKAEVAQNGTAALPPETAEYCSRRIADEWPRNPFFPGSAPEKPAAAAPAVEFAPAAGEFREEKPTYSADVLNAIVNGSTPCALLNGRIVRLGEEFRSGERLVSIGRTSITVRGPEGDRVITLRE